MMNLSFAQVSAMDSVMQNGLKSSVSATAAPVR